ncbi:MAG: 1-acyl-sn-glycerol-3-phosphate acyltransferase [Candidatus Tokpelaia sp. JSC188]|nr:MAG: 1-acyl-sn-glycerol-3-phosphate acyltransferase [Candidatus Tokpelaia sp. JSC188]
MNLLILRSLIFKVACLVITIIEIVIFAPIYFFLPHKISWIVPHAWIHSIFWLQKYLIGTTYEIEGIEHLPQGACIIAVKHQSTWEALALVLHVKDPTFILKNELIRTPGIGWYLAKAGMIPINRDVPIKALRAIIEGSRKKAQENRQIIIFPEGTRKPPGAEPHYKTGIFSIYSELDLSVIPVALNSGLYWPKQNLRCYPGKIRCCILPPIKPGLEKKQFMSHLETEIEKACDKLLLSAAKNGNSLAMPPTAVRRLEELGITWKGLIRL